MVGRSFGGIAAVALLGVFIWAPSTAWANQFENPSFEVFHEDNGPRPTGWTYWDNTYSVLENTEGSNFPAHSGERMEKTFGNWAFPWNSAGVWQEFPASEGELWEIDCFTYNTSDLIDTLTGTQNFMVMKIEFYDIFNAEWPYEPLAFVESVVLDGNSPQDMWIDNEALQAMAPPDTVAARGIFVFLQPDFEGGAAFLDDVSFVPEPASLGLLALGGLALLRRRG